MVSDQGCYDPTEILGSEKAGLRALSLSVMRSVVEHHKGHLMGDEVTEYIDIDVPEGEEKICAQEIGEQMGLICHHMYRQVDALFKGKILIRFAEN
jgi:hypothetical protein